MKAICWYGPHDMRVETVPEPQILNPRDAIVKVSATAICGSDIHFYDGYIPGFQKGDIVGHEFMGEIVEVGREVTNLQIGDRVVVPFTIACGHCFFCERGMWSLCDNSNPNARVAEMMYGYSASGLFGYSHIYGGYAGGQAEIERDEIDPSFVITHRMTLEDAPHGYAIFKNKEDNCIKVILRP